MVSETEFERIVKDLNDKLKEEYPMCCGEDILVHDDAQMAVLRSLATVWEGYDGKVNVSYDVMRLKYEYLEADELEILLEEYVRDIIDA